MKRIRLIISLLVFVKIVFCQDSHSLLKDVSVSLPDSIYTKTGFSKQTIKKIWKEFESNPEKSNESYSDKIIRDYNFQYSELNSQGECCKHFFHFGIDMKNSLFKIKEDCQLQIKIFETSNIQIIGVSMNFPSGFAGPEVISTVFYIYENGNFTDYTDEVFKGFNFATDNYSKETVDWLNKHYQRNRYKEPLPKFLIYTFTPSDTIYIFEDFYDFSCCEDGNFYLDKDHMLQALFWRAYVFKDCKLNPVGDVKKEKWEGKSLFE
jgi:hypothetical protein